MSVAEERGAVVFQRACDTRGALAMAGVESGIEGARGFGGGAKEVPIVNALGRPPRRFIV